MKFNKLEPTLIHHLPEDLPYQMKKQIIPVFREDAYHDGALCKTFIDLDKIHISDISYPWVESVPKIEIGFLCRTDSVRIISFHKWGYISGAIMDYSSPVCMRSIALSIKLSETIGNN